MLPLNFYHFKKSIEPRFSFIPTGNIYVNRLIRGLAYWRRTVSSTIQQNKTLVLADWTAQGWSGKKRELVIKRLYELLDEGFRIHAWQSGQIEEITKDNLVEFLKEPQILERMTVPAMRSDIEAVTINELPNVVKDQILILDDYQINGLIHPEAFNTPRELDIAEILEYKLKQDLEKLIPILRTAIPPITNITDSVVSDDSYDVIQKLQKLLPEIPIKTHFQSVTLTDDIVTQLFSANKAAEISKRTIHLAQLQFLEDVTLERLSKENFAKLLPLLPNIQKLKLLGCSFSSDFSINKAKFPFLEKIKLIGTHITAKNLNELMFGATNLNKLVISGNSSVSDNYSLDSLRLPNFKLIKLVKSSFSKENYQQFLRNNQLNRLVFKGSSIISNTLTELKGIDFFSIKTIEIDDCSCDSKYLEQMFTLLPQLEHLTIVKGSINKLQSSFTLQSLKTLTIDLDRFNDIADAFNNIRIEKLMLLDKDTLLTPNLTKINLNLLKHFQLQKNKINHAFLKSLLQKAIILNHLDLQGCTNLSALDNSFNFENIETLNLSDTDISTQSLKTILEKASNLKRLDLTGCKNVLITPEMDGLLRGVQVYYPDHIKIEKKKPTYHTYNQSGTGHGAVDISSLMKSGNSDASKGGDPNKENPSENGDPSKNNDPSNVPLIAQDSFSNTEKVDADTKDTPQPPIKIKRVFFPLTPGVEKPETSQYRENIFHDIEISKEPCTVRNAFVFNKKGDLDLVACDSILSEHDVTNEGKKLIHSVTHNYFYGKKDLRLTQEWQPLPSLSAQERLTHYHFDQDAQNIELQYSKRDNQYYIRSNKENKNLSIDFLVEVPKKTHTLPLKIEQLVDEFTGTNEREGYGSGDLEMKKPNPNGMDFLNAIMAQRKGACRHRTVAFMHLMKEQFPDIPVRAMLNKTHLQPEIFFEGEWISRHLGGYAANKVMDEGNDPTSNPDLPTFKSTSEKDKELFEGDANIVKYLQTWKKIKQQELTIEEYCKHLLEPRQEKKYLVEMTNKESNQSLLLAIKDYCKKNNKPLFSIDRPDDLTCSAAYLTNEKNKGVIHDGPGGPLHDFLKKSYDKNNPPIILINHDTFDPDDIVHHNSLYEDIQKADGTRLPPGTIVVALTNISKPTVYLGEDLTSRMDKHEPCPLPDKLLTSAYPELALKPFETVLKRSTPINLFNADNWKDILLGQWIVDGNDLYFEEGALKKALTESPIINIQNGLWEDDSFKMFWREAFINRYIDYEGQRIDLPPNFDFVVQKGYAWDKLKSNLQCLPGFNLQGEVLNPDRFNLFFSQYEHLEATKGLKKIPGIIEKHAGTVLSINLTRDINEDEWARILTECNTHNVKLVCNYSHQTKLPAPLQNMKRAIASDAIASWNKAISPLMLIKSSDRDTTVHQLTQQFKEYEYIDVSELEASDLLERLNGTYEKETRRFEFTKVPMTLDKALKKGSNIILTGKFSDSLLDSLMPVLLERASKPDNKGSLALVFDETLSYNVPNLTSHQVKQSEKLDILKKYHPEKELSALTPQQVIDEELSQLHARLHYHHQNPKEQDTSKAWDGLYELSSKIQLPDFDLNRSEEKTKEIIEQRIQKMRSMLSQSPLLYMSGLTGVGKTTFITKYFSKLHDVNLYVGEEKLTEWALDDSDKLKVIFIDEANIGKRQWSEFEGLFSENPSIVINGQHHLLSKDGKHVAIFAGNPLNYGSERQLAPLFERHGNAMVIEPMIGEFIYEEILKPLFEKTSLEDKAKEVSQEVLSVYKYLINLSTKEVLISTRELQLMILLTLSYHHQHPNEDFRAIAAHYAYQIGKTMVPYEKTKEFDDKFKPKSSLYPSSSLSFKIKKSNFLITPSRQEIYHLMEDLLNLRQFKQNHCHNDAQKFGGIGGLVLEGEPGIGKSEMVSAILGEHDFTEGAIDFDPEDDDVFYRIPISMRNEDKQSLSLRGLEKGASEIIDEGNSAPFLERWYNDILMQINPITKKHPAVPGSFMWLTQNPVTMAGRQRPSNALSRRVITFKLPPYPQEEMVSILINEGLESELAEKMVTIYVNLVNYAHRNYLTPAPTFRNLLRLARIASNSNQKDALDDFFNKIQLSSLRLSMLKAENRFKSNTVAALVKHLTPETLTIFDLNIALFDSLITKSMTEEKVKFMLEFMLFLNKTFGALDKEQIKYFDIMCDLPLEEIGNFNSLNAFFAKNPGSLADFFKRVKTIDPGVLIGFINTYSDYPDLISNVLNKEKVDAQTLADYLDKSKSYIDLLKAYGDKHKDAIACSMHVLRLSQFLSLNNDNFPFKSDLIEATPPIIMSLANLLEKYPKDFKGNIIHGLLKFLTNDDLVLFNFYPSLLEVLLKQQMDHLKLEFLLVLLRALNKTNSPLDNEQIEYFEMLSAEFPSVKGDVKYVQINLDNINEFFTKNPMFLKGAFKDKNVKNSLPIENLFLFIDHFRDHPELVSHILAGNFADKLFKSAHTDLSLLADVVKTYRAKHKDATNDELVQVLECVLLFGTYAPVNYVNELTNANPRLIKLLTRCFDENINNYKLGTIVSLLKHLSDKTISYFEKYPVSLLRLMQKECTDAEVKFMLDILSLLHKVVLKGDDQEAIQVERIINLPLKAVNHYSKVVAFFTDNPSAFSQFLARDDSDRDVLMSFINSYIKFPELINNILAIPDSNLLRTYSHLSYKGALKLYSEKYPGAGNAHIPFLRLVKHFKESLLQSWVDELMKTPPEVITWLGTLVAAHDDGRYKSRTMNRFLGNLSEENIKLFTLYPQLIDSILQKTMADGRVKFLIDLLSWLHKTFEPLDSNHIKYFQAVMDLPAEDNIKYDGINFNIITEFFTKNPTALPDLFNKVKPGTIEKSFLLIDRFKDNHELIKSLIDNEQFATELFQTEHNDPSIFPELVKIYADKNKDGASNYLVEFLKLGSFLGKRYIKMHQKVLADARPSDIKLLVASLGKKEIKCNLNTVISLLKNLSDNEVKLFKQNPTLLEGFMQKEMSDEKAQFMLGCLSVLDSTFGPQNSKIVYYFERMSNIDFNVNPEGLNNYFLNDKLRISSFMQAVDKSIPFEELRILINKLGKYPELIKKVLVEDSFDYSAKNNSLYSNVLTNLASKYYSKHPDADTNTVLEVLKLANVLTEQTNISSAELIDVLTNSKPKMLKLVSLFNIKKDGAQANTIIELLKHASDESITFFELHPTVLHSLVTNSMTENKIKFMLQFIAVLIKSFSYQELSKYVDQMIALPIEKSTWGTNVLNEFFAKKPKALNHFMSKVKPDDLDPTICFIGKFIEYPGLIYQILKKENIDTGLLHEMESNWHFYLTRVKNYTQNYPDASSSCLAQLLQLTLSIRKNGVVDRGVWQSLEKTAADRINKLHEWSVKYYPNVFLNLLFSKSDELVVNNSASEEFITKYTQKLLNNTAHGLFDFSKGFKFNHERTMLLHHLEQETFVADNKANALWSKEKNTSLLHLAYELYTTYFKQQAKLQKTKTLLLVSKELGGVPEANDFPISDKVTKDLSRVLSGYLGSFWIREQRKESASSLIKTINQRNMDYPRILEEISKARDAVYQNDTKKETGMHRFGSSRYYETLNRLEEILTNAWVANSQSITSFKAFLPYYENTLEQSKQSLDHAIDYEFHKNYKQYDYRKALDKCPGYIQALAKEVEMRESILEKYYRTVGEPAKAPEMA